MDVRKTQNYRAIALSSILGKILDNIIITSQRNVLKTSELQFGYKSNCSTLMCSTLVIETIQYFTQMRYPVYVLFIDASKVFDGLSHIELFDILSERNMCPLIRRLLFNLYGNQQFQIRWNNCLSNMYTMTNGVKQGAVLSPILFTMYIDGLFYELKRAGVGCHINGEYAGAFGHADDIVLLSPSLCALKHSITLCEDYAKRFKILFNHIQSKLMCFSVKHKDFVLYLCYQPVNLVEHETYLRNDIVSDIFDRSISHTVHTFYQKSNHVISDFRMLYSFSLHKLHSTYWMSLYGCELFNYNRNYISELYVAWRKVIRKIFKLPMRTHNYIVCGIVESVNTILDRRIAKYILNVINSDNTTLTSLINSFLNCESSIFAENYRYIMYKYNIPSTLWRRDFKTLILNISYTDDINDWQRINISTIQELCKMRDGILYSGLNTQEIQVLIDFICTEGIMPIP